MTFLQKKADISQIKDVLVLDDIFPESTYLYLRIKFQLFSIILMSFRQVLVLPLHNTKETSQNLTLVRVNHNTIKNMPLLEQTRVTYLQRYRLICT